MDRHVTVLERPRVTHRPDSASVPQEGRDGDVKKPVVETVLALTAPCHVSVPIEPAVMG